MMMIQYTNCVVKACKVQTVKQVLILMSCPVQSQIRLQTFIISYFRLWEVENFDQIL